MIRRLLRRLLARYRAWRRRGQVWVNGRRMRASEVADDVARSNEW